MLVVSQLARLSAGQRHDVNLRRALVGSFVHVGNRERYQIAFRRNLRIANASNFQEIVDREAALLRLCERYESKQTNQADGKETFHVLPRTKYLVVRESCAHYRTSLDCSRNGLPVLQLHSISDPFSVSP